MDNNSHVYCIITSNLHWFTVLPKRDGRTHGSICLSVWTIQLLNPHRYWRVFQLNHLWSGVCLYQHTRSPQLYLSPRLLTHKPSPRPQQGQPLYRYCVVSLLLSLTYCIMGHWLGLHPKWHPIPYVYSECVYGVYVYSECVFRVYMYTGCMYIVNMCIGCICIQGVCI
jgi:hypothetical protein